MSSNTEREHRKGVFIRTFGCQMNEYDSQKLFKLLEHDYAPVDAPEKADLVLINTCSVRDKPEQKLYSMLGRMQELKDVRPGMMVGVCGCVAQQEGEKILKRSKSVDFVFGTHNLSLVPSLIQLRKNGAPPQAAVDYREEWEDLPLGFAERKGSGKAGVTALISISRGCNKNCTYCIVPTTRGSEVSRSLDEILREARIAVHRGSRELLLLGQTVNSYGTDLKPRLTFVKLLEALAEIEGVDRIRFISPHPQEVRRDFIEFVATNPKMCRHIHMPLQSGSDTILKAMNRNYRRVKYLNIIEALKSRVPDIAVSTDIIVGFPGETEEDFQATLDMMDRVQFDNSYSYAFSPRPGTAAAELRDDVSREEKLERLQRITAKQESIIAKRMEAWIGKTVEVLLEGQNPADEKCLQGRTSQNFMLNLSMPDGQLKPGVLLPVKVTGQTRYTLIGEPI
jgi:tRNA-2-methylthio-N6-dimethylallyladenosine synthase